MKFLLPPYSKKHIIIFGSITFFVAISLLFATKYLPQITNKSDSIIQQTTAEDLKTDFKDEIAKVQEDKGPTAWNIDGFVVIDIRSTDDYNKQHIVGATNVPLSGLHLSSLNPDVNMVVYSPNQQDIDKAITILASKNIRNVYALHDTLDGLEQAGYKLAATE